MSTDLPAYRFEEFADELRRITPEPLSEQALEALYHHYLELRRWSSRLALVGPGTAATVLERHYGEALAALPLLGDRARELLDIGSGAGFPGCVLAAARPGLRVTLLEPRQRKWSFLMAAVRKASLPCLCLNARVEAPLPVGLPRKLDVVTVRALKLAPEVLEALGERLGPDGRILLWLGEETPEFPPALVPGRELRLPGSERRRILELCPAKETTRREEP